MTLSDGPVRAMSKDRADAILRESTTKPHEGRVYDVALGGTTNYAVDREFAKKQIARIPDIPWAVKENRKFLSRAVRHMIGLGIRQFIDIGSGLPTVGNVHQIAEREAPGECRVVYIDHDPIVSAHGYILLESEDALDRNCPIQGDLLQYEELLDAILATELVDFTEPVGLLMVAVLHFLPDDLDPHRAVGFFRGLAAPGSHLAISHVSVDGMPRKALEAMQAVLKDYDDGGVTSRALARQRTSVQEFFGDWELLDPPGVVWTPECTLGDASTEDQPDLDRDPYRAQAVAGVACKR